MAGPTRSARRAAIASLAADGIDRPLQAPRRQFKLWFQ
jgi:hypothetical protein